MMILKDNEVSRKGSFHEADTEKRWCWHGSYLRMGFRRSRPGWWKSLDDLNGKLKAI